MIPQEKAEELFNKFANVIYDRALTVMQYEICKECALIAVDEILKTNPYKARNYWQEVKTEIEKL